MDPANAQRLAAIVHSSVDAIVGKDLQGIVNSWNRSAERLFGYSAEEMIGQSITAIVPADRQDEERVILSRIRRGERIESYETVRVRKDGTLVPVSLTISPVRDESGGIVGASKIAREITERKQMEQALARQTRLYEAILTNTPDLAYVFDLDHRFIYANESLLKMWGKSREQAIGKSCLELGYVFAQGCNEPAAAVPLKHGEEESGLRAADLRCGSVPDLSWNGNSADYCNRIRIT